jgi:hypothetical protein
MTSGRCNRGKKVRVQDSGLNQDPLLRSFSEHNLSSCYQNWTCESSFERSQHQQCFLYWTHGYLRLWPTLQRPKSQIFNIGHDYTLWIRNFMVMKKLENLDFDWAQWLTAIIWPKSQNSNIIHEGILSIEHFILMINNHFAFFQLPGNLLKTKKKNVLPIFVATRNFLFIFPFKNEENFNQFWDPMGVEKKWIKQYSN